MTKNARASLIIIGVMGMIFLAGILVPYFLKDVLKERLITSVEKNEELPFQLSISKLNLNIWSRALKLDSVVLKPKRTSQSIEIQAEHIYINEINWFNFFFKEKPDISFSKLSIKGITGHLPKQLYRFKIDEFVLDDNTLIFKKGQLIPMLPRYEFSKKRGKQTDRIELKLPSVKITGIKPDSIINGRIHVDTLLIENAKLEIFRNKKIPRAPSDTLKPTVNDMARNISFPLQVKTALVENATIIYSEHRPPAATSASISFNHLNGTIYHFRSESHPNFTEDTLKLHVETMFMNESLLTVDITYPVFRNDDRHTINLQLDSIDPKAASDMLKYVGFVKVNSGMIHSLKAHYRLDDTSAVGEMTLIYSELDVSFLNKNDPDRNGIKEAVTDFFTDHFIVESENPADDPRKGQIHFERKQEKSIFAYWWKSLLSGIKDTIK